MFEVWVGCGSSSCGLGRVWIQLSNPWRALVCIHVRRAGSILDLKLELANSVDHLMSVAPTLLLSGDLIMDYCQCRPCIVIPKDNP